jgi:ADP-heptose:LPS heptosyltransferase
VDAADPALLKGHGLEKGGYVACQPLSNNVKKNYPMASWRRVFAAFPNQKFVMLGTDKQAVECARLDLPNVHSLCGKTSLIESAKIVDAARMFVGIDSGLAHVATCLGKPTLVVSHSTNLGYFFPYPAELGFDNVQVVRNQDYDECSGCFTACTQEPIWNTYRQGALCLRTLPTQSVIEALAEKLQPAETAAGKREDAPADATTPSA